MPRNTQSQSQSQAVGKLDEKEKDAAAANLVFYILCREKGRPIHKKADLMKAINLNGKGRLDQDEVLDRATHHLKDVFGFDLYHLDNLDVEDAEETQGGGPSKYKNQYALTNSLSHSIKAASGNYVPAGTSTQKKNSNKEEPIDDLTAMDKAKTSLLYSLLSLIFMSPGSVVRDETLDKFLVKMGLMTDYNATERVGPDPKVEEMVKKIFGVQDIKVLLKDEFIRQKYIDAIESDDLDEGTGKSYEYRWGIRARFEMRKAEILKNVAKMYSVKPSDFKEQYDRVMDSNESNELEGGDAAGDAEDEQMDTN